LGVVYPIAFILDLPLRWLVSLVDLVLIHWGTGLLERLRRKRGYVTAGSIVAVYFAIYGLIDTKSTQEETQATVERNLFMSMVISGNVPSFVAAMQNFGPVQTMEVTAHPDPFRLWTWRRTYPPNLKPMWQWARARLGTCKPNECSLDLKVQPENTRIELVGADLRGADLHIVGLSRANLFFADLSGADLSGADLRDANLAGAGLRGADLRNADLRDADLLGVDLRDADLRDADLRGTGLGIVSPDNFAIDFVFTSTAAALSRAKYNGKTKFPDGFDPKAAEAAGMVLVP
jgi:hypothetical protein